MPGSTSIDRWLNAFFGLFEFREEVNWTCATASNGA